MLRLAIGLGLVGAAAYAGRSSPFGASVTTGTDTQAQREVYLRSHRLIKAVRRWENYLAFGAEHELPGKAVGCQRSRRFYHQALDELAETRSGIRHPRIVRLYQGGQGTASLNAAVLNLDGALRTMRWLKKVHDTACPSPLPPIPLSASLTA